MKLPANLLGSAEVALNRALGSTPAAAATLERLAGRSLRIRLQPPGAAFDVLVSAAGFTLLPEDDVEATAQLDGSPLDLLAAFASGQVAGRMQLHGDSAFAVELLALLHSLNWDVEAWLSRLTGDQLGLRLARGLRSGGRWLASSAGKLELDAAEYLSEETRDLVHRSEGEDFMAAVDTLRADADRLQARLQQLQAQRAEPPC